MNNWDDIRYFLALSRSGSVSAAAKALAVNHTTVSRRIQALEEAYHVRLFERTPKGYEMTDAAAEIYELALQLEAQNHLIARKLVGQDQRLSGVINITMPHDIYELLLANDIKQFQGLYPNITLNFSVSKNVRNLANREADIAVRLTSEPPDYLVGRKICELRHALYQPKNLHHESCVPVIAWSFEDNLPQWAIDNYGEKAEIVLRIDDLTSMHSAVAAGTGVARMPMYLPDHIQHPNVVKIKETLPYSDWGVWVLTHVDLRKTARVQIFKQFLEKVLSNKIGVFQGS